MGPNMPTNADTNAAIAVIGEQVKALVDGQLRTERQLEKLDPINVSLGEMRVSLALKADQAALNAVDSKVAGWVGHFRGALTVATLALGAIQAALVGGAGWMITHIQNNDTAIAVQGARLDEMRRDLHAQSPTGSKTQWTILRRHLQSSSASKRV
jgi:hypothetical protein